MNNCTTKRTFQQIPVNIEGSLQSIYLYAKITMLEGKWYSETSLGKNATTHKQEIDRHTVSKCVHELHKSGFITIEKQYIEDECYYQNIYHINLSSELWIPVMNDFINLPKLSPSEKGFAIKMACLKVIPKTTTELCAIIGISINTCKKYIKSLEAAGILNGLQLNETYFPNLRKEAYKRKYELKLQELEQLTGNKRVTKMLDWFEKNLTPDKFPYKFLYNKLVDIETGFWDRQSVRKEIKHMYNVTL